MGRYYFLFLLMLMTGEQTAANFITSDLPQKQVVVSGDSLKKSIHRLELTNQKSISTKSIWKRIGKILLYVLIILAAVYLLVGLVVLGLTSGIR